MITDAKTKKGDKLFQQAEAAEARKDWAKAVDLYTQAVEEDPKEPRYLISMRRVRFAGSMEILESARDVRREGNLPEAIAAFQRAVLMDPSSAIAMEELKRTQEMLAQPIDDPALSNLTPAERARKEAEIRSSAMLGLPELNPPNRKIGPVRMNNQPINILYNTLAGLAGISVVWDSSWPRPARGFDLNLEEMDVEQAFDQLGLITKTYWKVLSPTSIFVTDDTETKRRDYADTVVKTLFVTNAATAQEFNEIQTAVRTITDIRRVYPYVAQKALVVRGDADAVALAEKLIMDLDQPRSEVVVDVMIMEANSARTRDLASTLASSAGAAGLNVGGLFAPRPGLTRGASSGAAVPISNLGKLSSADFTTTLPGALLQAILTDSRTKILNHPQVRASDGQKARLEIGDRIPIASGSFQTGVTGASGVGVNTTFQFQPVGVIIDITPTVHSSSEVTLHVELEVSNVKSYVDVGNIKQPVVGQNKSSADLRLREGEVNILAGLTRQQDADSVTGIPGLVSLPILGKVLFGSSRTERDRGDLMIALVPHIVRTPNYSRDNLRGIASGGDQRLKLTYAPKALPPNAQSSNASPDSAVEAVPPATTAPLPAAMPPIAVGPVEAGVSLASANPDSASSRRAELATKAPSLPVVPARPAVSVAPPLPVPAPPVRLSTVSQVKAAPKRAAAKVAANRKTHKTHKTHKVNKRAESLAHRQGNKLARNRPKLLAASLPAEPKRPLSSEEVPVVSVPISLVQAPPPPARVVVVRQIPIQPATFWDDLNSLRQAAVARILDVTGQTAPGPGWWAALFGLVLAALLGSALSIATLLPLLLGPRAARGHGSLKSN